MTSFWKIFVVFIGAGLCVFDGVHTVQIQKSSFSCDGRTSGYYADVASGCQVYHMCDGLGRQFSYKCPKNTLFQQRMLICDHWYMVNCSKSEEDYSANLLIGQQGRAFIEDLQFQRTPRPDLAGTDYNLFRTTQGAISTKNLVGADEEDSHFATDIPEYFPPSHWSTEFSTPTTPTPYKREESDTQVPGLVKQIFYSTNYRTGKRVLSNKEKDANSYSINSFANSVNDESRFKLKTNQEKTLPNGVNFPSSFKATTPIYPKDLNIDLSKFTDFANAPEEIKNNNNNAIVHFPSNYHGTTPLFPFYVGYSSASLSIYDIPNEDTKKKNNNFVNFASDFQATTPVFPLQVEVEQKQNTEFDYPIIEDLYDDLPSINFGSKFKGTTPVYPKDVNIDLSKFSGSEEVAPKQKSSSDDVVVNFPSDFKATTPVYPKEVETDLSKFSDFEDAAPIENHENNNNNVIVNFASNFKATTPVYPKKVDVDLSKFYGSEETAPGENANDDVIVNFPSNYKGTTPVYPSDAGIDQSNYSGTEELPPKQNNDDVIVNFASNFKATTPVYPKEVNIDLSKFGEPVETTTEKSTSKTKADFVSDRRQDYSPTDDVDEFGLLPPRQSGDSQSAANNDLLGLLPSCNNEATGFLPTQRNNIVPINFRSKFQATTPVYPESVEPTSPDPNDVGLLAPKLTNNNEYSLPSQDIQPPSFESTFKRRIDEEDPSLLGNTFSSQQLNKFMVTIRPEQLREIQELWRIPEYDFPLDNVALRPSYESQYSSFQANVKAAKSR